MSVRRGSIVRAALLAAVTLGAAACEGRPRAASGPSSSDSSDIPASARATGVAPLVELDLSKGAPEQVQGSLFGPAPRRSHLDLVRVIRSLDGDESDKGVFVRLGSTRVGLARAQEIGTLLGELKKRGRPIVCHADEYNNGSLLLASRACSKVWVSPAGQVDAVGLAAQLLFANRLLTKLQIGVDFLQVGKYKGAEEPFTRNEPSPEARASLEGTLRGLRAAWIAGIAEGRGKPELAEIAEDGPFTPEDAKSRGLVDEVGDVEDAREAAKKLAGTERVVSRFGSGGGGGQPKVSRGVVDVLRSLTGAGRSVSAKVVVVPAIGSIAMGGGRELPIGDSDGIGEKELGRDLDDLIEDDQVKAVVLRIDSPGGSALASDLLWKRLMRLREKKPLVVSVGGMAASGGYYLACAGNKIIAEPTSILGSIGVVGGKLAIGKTLEEIGVHAETIAASPDPKKAARAAYMSPFSPWDDETRGKVLTSMTSIYDLFLRRIAEGRGTTVDKVAPSAEGRIFGGVEAKERGLVDELGGFDDALKLAFELAKLPKDTPYEIIGDSSTLFDLLDGGDAESGEARAAAAQAAAGRAAREAMLPWAAWGEVAPEVGGFVGSVAPLARGERVVAALPFGLLVR